MNCFVCPNCNNTSYTADTSQAQKCPYCVEKHLIINSDIMELLKSYNTGSLKLIINRRKAERRSKSTLAKEDSRRVSDRRRNRMTPIGWLLIKHPQMTT